MNKRKVIRNFTIPCSIITIISLSVFFVLILINKAQLKNHEEEFKVYISDRIEENKNYIKEIAGKIKSLPLDQLTINQLQSDYMADNQKAGQPKRYLWMSSVEGDFLFGVPFSDFQKLNDKYNKYQTIIKNDNYYRDRNDFFDKLIVNSNTIDFSQSNSSNGWTGQGWRFYKETNNMDNWDIYQSTSTSYTFPVYDNYGKLIGNLFLKVDDKSNIEKYYNEHRFQRSDLWITLNNLSVILLIISLLFLWFLLPTWIYIDAQERDIRNPGIWAFLVLISLVFGLVVYLLIRPSSIKSIYCPKCNGELNGTGIYCPFCGHDLTNAFCQQCQYPIKQGWKFCPNCRTEINP
jgi:hypothetical protein